MNIQEGANAYSRVNYWIFKSQLTNIQEWPLNIEEWIIEYSRVIWFIFKSQLMNIQELSNEYTFTSLMIMPIIPDHLAWPGPGDQAWPNL